MIGRNYTLASIGGGVLRHRSSLLACTAFTALVAGGLVSPVSVQQVRAAEECGGVGAGDPYTVSCGEGPYNNGIEYRNQDTDDADSVLFNLNNTQVNRGGALGGNNFGASFSTNEAGNNLTVNVNHVLPGVAPSINGGDILGLGNTSGMLLNTSGNNAPVEFTLDGGTVTAGDAGGLATQNGIRITTSGSESDVDITLGGVSNIVIDGGNSSAASNTTGFRVSTSGSDADISFVVNPGTAAGGGANTVSITGGDLGGLGTSNGVSLNTSNTNSAIVVDLTDTSISGGQATAGATTSGFVIGTTGSGSGVNYQQSGGDTKGGSVTAAGISNGVSITTTGADSDVTFLLDEEGTISSGTSSSGLAIGHGVNISTGNNDTSDITFETAEGTTISSSIGNGVNLSTNGSDILAGDTINGTIESTQVVAGVGVGIGFNGSAGGGGDANVHIGETGIVRGTGAGLVATAEDGGDVTLRIDGEAHQTSETASSLNSSLFLLPVAVGGAATDGDVTITASSTSTISQIGSTAIVPVKGIGILGVNSGTGNTTVTADGTLSATGIGALAFAESGSATTNVGGTISVGGGTGVSPLGALSLGSFDLTVGAAAVSGGSFAQLNVHGGNIGDFDTLDATPDIGGMAVVLGGDDAASVDVGDGLEQASNIYANEIGLLALNLGTGDANIDIEDVDPEGDGNVVNSDGIGLMALALDGGNADVEARNSTINSVETGILAVGSNVWVDANDVTSQNGSGILAFGGEVDIDVHGDVTGNGGFFSAAVSGISTGSFSVEVDEGASINTQSGTSGDAINAASGTGITVINDGTINGNMNLFSTSGNNYVENNSDNSWNWSGFTTITALNGDNNLVNNGTASAGPTSFTALISSGDSTIDNTDGSTFNMIGLNGLAFVTGGDATINNDGEFNAIGLNGFFFDADGASTFNNTGEFNVALSSLFLGLDTFNADGGSGDAGIIDMQNGLPFGTLVMVGTNYNTEVDVDHYIDADLDGPFSFGADFMSIGSVTGAGTTFVHVNDLDTGPGEYNGYGISIVGVEDGNADVADFRLANGPIQKGFFDYNIYLDKGNTLDHPKCSLISGANSDCFLLIGAEGQRSFELPVIAYGAQNMWHTSTGTWSDRTADLRAAFGGTGFGGGGADAIVEPLEPAATVGNVTPGIWGRVFGSTQSRDFTNSYAIDGLEVFDDRINNNFDQDIYGAMAGIDFGKESLGSQGNQAWIFGLFGGYTGSNLTFDASDTDVDYKAGSVGAYVTYLNGGLFVDATLKADFGKMDYSAGGDSDSADFTSVGGVVDAGYRMNMASGWYVEPKATLAYVNTDFDDIDVFGTEVSFDDGDSLRGRLGGRLGATMDRNGMTIEPYVEASVWNEFEGDYAASYFSNADGFNPTFDAEGVYGEVALGSSFINAGNGWSGFAKGAVQFGEDSAIGWTGNLGLRKAW